METTRFETIDLSDSIVRRKAYNISEVNREYRVNLRKLSLSDIYSLLSIEHESVPVTIVVKDRDVFLNYVFVVVNGSLKSYVRYMTIDGYSTKFCIPIEVNWSLTFRNIETIAEEALTLRNHDKKLNDANRWNLKERRNG